MSTLTATNVCKTFGSKRNPHVVLENFSTAIPKGSLCALLGKNGAGKTTFIKCATGIYLPDSGKIFVGSDNILENKRARIRNLTVLLDGGRNLYRYMTVEENIKYFAKIKGTWNSTEAIKNLTNKAIKAMQVEDFLKKTIDKLSSGMAQRAAIAVAMACASPIVILDEPTKGLDFEMKRDLLNLLKTLKEDFNSTIILCSHELEFVEELADFIVLVDGGKVVKEGKLEDFQSLLQYNTYKLYLTNTLDTEVETAIRGAECFRGINSENSVITISVKNGSNVLEVLSHLHGLGLNVSKVDSDDKLGSIIERITSNERGM